MIARLKALYYVVSIPSKSWCITREVVVFGFEIFNPGIELLNLRHHCRKLGRAHHTLPHEYATDEEPDDDKHNGKLDERESFFPFLPQSSPSSPCLAYRPFLNNGLMNAGAPVARFWPGGWNTRRDCLGYPAGSVRQRLHAEE